MHTFIHVHTSKKETLQLNVSHIVYVMVTNGNATIVTTNTVLHTDEDYTAFIERLQKLGVTMKF